MSPKLEKQLQKLKALDDRMITTLETLRVQKELVLNAREEETRLYNEVNTIEKQLGLEKDVFFELLRSGK